MLNVQRFFDTVWMVRVGLFVGLLGTLLLFRGVFFGQELVWADDFDSGLSFWILEWGYKVLFLEGSPSEFWNANSFYPHLNTLAYSDSFLGAQFFYSPLRLIGFSPVFSTYAMLALTCLLSCVISDYSLVRLGGFTSLERGIIVYSSHFGLYVFGFLYHYQLFGIQYGISFLFVALIFLQKFRFRDLLTGCVLVFLGVSFSMYLAPMLMVCSVFVLAPLFFVRVYQVGLRYFLGKVGVRGLATVLGTFILLYFVQIGPYLEVAKEFPKQSFDETYMYSARVTSIFEDVSARSLWYGDQNEIEYGDWERPLFPGYLLLTAVFFVFFLLASNNNARVQLAAVMGNSKYLLPFSCLLFASCYFFSLGPYVLVGETDSEKVRMPFAIFSAFLPGLDSMRSPGRFAMLMGPAYGIIAVLGIRLVLRNRGAPTLFGLMFLLILIFESLPSFSVYPANTQNFALYKELEGQLNFQEPLLEIPLVASSHLDTYRNVMQQLNASNIHGGAMVVGYGAKFSEEHHAFLHLDRLFQEGDAKLSDIIGFCNKLAIKKILIHRGRLAPLIEKDLNAELDSISAELASFEEIGVNSILVHLN